MAAREHGSDVAPWSVSGGFAAFVAVLCISIIIDHAPYPRLLWDAWLDDSAIEDPAEVFVRSGWVLLAAWTILRPSSVFRYALLCSVGASVILSRLPTVPNHWLLELAVFLGSLLVLSVARGPKQRLFGLRVLLWASILSLYAWAFVHKLNSGFLDPETSCGAVFLDSITRRLGLPPPSDRLRAGAVYAVLLAEGAMPPLLLGSRLRGVAILLGIGLHLAFGLFVPGFSLFMLAAYFMLLPDGSLHPLLSRMATVRARAMGHMMHRVSPVHLPRWLGQTIAWLLLLTTILLIKDVPRPRGLTQQETLWLPLALVTVVGLACGLRASRMSLPIATPTPPVLAAALVFPMLLLVNGAVPYFGIRNALAFSMFSNLRTENGQSNHLFLPTLETRLSVLDDQIRIVESSDPVLHAYTRPQNRLLWNWTALIAKHQKADFELPFFMLRYRAQQVRDQADPMFSVRFTQGGTVHDLSADEVEALDPVGKLSGWLHWSKGTPLPPHRDACMW